MIYFIVAEHNRHTLRWFLTMDGRELGSIVRVRRYSELFRETALPLGTYIFTDMESLVPRDLERAATIWTTLEPEGVRLLNHPLWAMQRYELNRTLHDSGINDFDVYRATERRVPRRFPVFLRNENDHLGPATELLHDAGELETAVAQLVARGVNRETLMISEFAAEPDEHGVYRKYGAFCLDGEIIPNHMIFSHSWQTKGKERVDDESTVAEELAFVEGNPHRDQILQVFQLARIQYGRVDYGFLEGRMQVYEINTNGTVMGQGKGRIRMDRTAKRKVLASRLIARLRELDANSSTPGAPRGSVRLHRPFMGWRGRLASRMGDWYQQLDQGLPHFLRNQWRDQRW